MNQEKTDYPLLFSPFKMGCHTMKNRVVALPVHTGFALPDGHASHWMKKHYSELAESGAAMVVVANAAVSKDGVVSKYNLRADKDRFVPGLAALANAIKERGAIACLQLNHAGRFAKTVHPLLPSALSSENLPFNVESLKGFMEFFPFEKRFKLTKDFLVQLGSWRRAMEPEERDRVIDDFASAAFRAYTAGFDVIELHGANGYLLCQFLSPFTNKLTSEFGGDLEGRAAFPLAVVQAVKQKLPDEFPLGFRLLLREWVPGGLDFPEALAFAKLLEKNGVAYLSAASGTFNSIFSDAASKKMGKVTYLRRDSRELSSRVDVPVIISGRITMPSMAENMIRSNAADLVGLGRPLRCDPDWINKAKGVVKGKIQACINCNWCLKQVILEKGLNCRLWPGQVREKVKFEHKLLTRTEKTLWVVSDTRDIKTFKHCKSLIIPDKQNREELFIPDIVFLNRQTKDPAFESYQKEFPVWAKDCFMESGFSKGPGSRTVDVAGAFEDVIDQEVNEGGYGWIFLGADKKEPWRAKMLYRIRGRVVGLLNSNERQHSIIALLDLSDASMLVMRFLKKRYMKEKGFSISFVHIQSGRADTALQRWELLKSITGFDPDVPLEVIEPETDVVSAINETIQSGRYGTVVMGKRGLSGLKLWLLGSVSSGVLDHLTDQSLFLVD